MIWNIVINSHFTTSQCISILIESFNSGYKYYLYVNNDTIIISNEFNSVIYKIFKNLQNYPALKWANLCDALEPQSILSTALTYCDGFEWQYLDLATNQLLISSPLNETYRAAQYINPNILKTIEGEAIQHLNQIAALKLKYSASLFLLSAMNYIQISDDIEATKALRPEIATLLCWNWAKMVFKKNMSQ